MPGAPESGLELSAPDPSSPSGGGAAAAETARQTILLRNRCLQIVADVAEQDAVSDPARLDDWLALLGYDWLLLFLQVRGRDGGREIERTEVARDVTKLG